MIGARIGPYEILEKLGAGGMGEVYRARDARIGRDVAVKILPAAFASDPARLSRFEQEARAAGQLNHPNILAIFDAGTHDGSPYLVTELLEGETLRQRIAALPVPLRKTLEIAGQIANGLGAAHEKGIVHRDLKPENVFVTRDGRVKILDFGLAKLTLPEDSAPGVTSLPTTPVHTEPGLVLGTASYMSPEQVRGQPADSRSDLFALGAILHEMLAGRHPFRRGTSVETMTAILREEPPELLDACPGLPPALERIVRHCLEKNPAERFQSARDLAFDLEAVSRPAESSGRSAAVRIPRLRRGLLGTGALIGTVLVAAAAAYLAGRASRPAVQPGFERLTFRRGTVLNARFAPDGHTVVYGAAWDDRPFEIFTTRPGGPESQPLGIPDADLLSVSRRNELAILLGRRTEAGWMSRGTLARVSLTGGSARQIAEDVQDADWSPDGRELAIVRFGQDRYRLEHPIGKVLAETDGWFSHPRFSPDGRWIAFLDHPVRGDDLGGVAVMDAGGGGRRALVQGMGTVWGTAWSPDGKEIWFAGGEGGVRDLRAVTLDGTMRIVAALPGQKALLDVFRDGRVLHTVDDTRRELAGVLPGEGHPRNLSWLDWSFPQGLTPDGRLVVVEEQGAGAGGSRYAIYLRGTDGSPPARIGEGFARAVSPDGKWIAAIRSAPERRIVLLPTGVGSPLVTAATGFEEIQAMQFRRDGKRLFFAGREPGSQIRIYALDLPDGGPRPVTPEGISGLFFAVRGDGTEIAALDSGERLRIYSVEGGASRPVAGEAGEQPGEIPIRFSDDGRWLYTGRRGGAPARIDRVDLATGKREPWREIRPVDPNGIVEIGPVFLSSGETYVYSVRRVLSTLYLADGLR
jgi:Tol biopolymer transport system component